jgi:hypothetical protein
MDPGFRRDDVGEGLKHRAWWAGMSYGINWPPLTSMTWPVT